MVRYVCPNCGANYVAPRPEYCLKCGGNFVFNNGDLVYGTPHHTYTPTSEFKRPQLLEDESYEN